MATVARAHAVLPQRVAFADQDGQQRVVAESIMIVEVLVAQAQAIETLLEQVRHRVLDEVGVAVIAETAGELFDEAELGFDFAQEQSTGVGGNVPAVKGSDNRAAIE